jgi:hypothetical protein
VNLDDRSLVDRLMGRGIELQPVDADELERLVGSIERASGAAICDVCGHEYRRHKPDPRIQDHDGRFSTILLCDGRLVHL